MRRGTILTPSRHAQVRASFETAEGAEGATGGGESLALIAETDGIRATPHATRTFFVVPPQAGLRVARNGPAIEGNYKKALRAFLCDSAGSSDSRLDGKSGREMEKSLIKKIPSTRADKE